MEIPEVIREKARDFKEKELEVYVGKVFGLLGGMKPGDSITIVDVTKPVTRELFVETIKFYMRSKDWQDGLSFGKDFGVIRKYELSFLNGKKRFKRELNG